MSRAANQSEPRTVLHPATGALILATDWIFFGADLFSFGATMVASSLAAFGITAAGTYWIQRSRAGDSRVRALLKALFGGIVAGIPTSLAGTVVGTAVLALAGLRRGPAFKNGEG